MPTVRKVQSKAKLSVPVKSVASQTPQDKRGTQKQVGKETREEGENGRRIAGQETPRTKKACFFCKSKTQPRYYESVSLRKFINDRGRILPRGRSGACAKHQRGVSREIKRARLLALLPFSPQI